VAIESGIYARFGKERKDLITEATAQEFKNWFAIKGLDISFMSDGTLNGDFMETNRPFLQWEIRLAFIADLQAKGVKVYKEKEAWEAFLAKYREANKLYYG
jgi:hypothetical protein